MLRMSIVAECDRFKKSVEFDVPEEWMQRFEELDREQQETGESPYTVEGNAKVKLTVMFTSYKKKY